jgi:hypothetical protein
MTFFSDLDEISRKYIFMILFVLTFVTNLTCFVILIKIVLTSRHQVESSSQMFKYLLIKSVCDMLPGLFKLLTPLANDNKYYIQVWFIWFHEYLSNVFYLASGMFEIAASFECAISIEGRLKWCQTKFAFVIQTLFIFISCFSFYSFDIFTNKIIEIKSDTVINGTVVEQVCYASVLIFKYYHLIIKLTEVERIIRDISVLLILIIINLFILFKMIGIRKRKSQLQTVRSSNIMNAERAESRKIKMITFLCVIFVIGHFPYDIHYFFHNSGSNWDSFGKFCSIFFYFSFTTPILAYYLFNRKFNYFLMKLFKRNIDNNTI